VEESPAGNKKSKKPLTNERREERNLREKERSLKITQQIHELRELLSLGGVIVPKGTKSTILTEAANYIRLLQQHQYRSEMDKAQLVQEVQRIGNGAIGEKAAYAIRHAAAQNGVSSMANLPENGPGSSDPADPLSDNLGDREYRCVFNSCSVGMAIATMGGSFIDCNIAFTQLSSYTKQELKAMTIFNITSRDDLQGAFDMMSQLITPSTGGLDADGNTSIGDDGSKGQSPVILRSAIRHRSDLGLSVSLIRGEDNVARYFSVTLVKLPPSPLGLGAGLKPVPAMAEMSPETPASQAQQQLQHQQQQHRVSLGLGQVPSSGMPLQMQQQPDAGNKMGFQGMNTPQYTAG
jgi:PAS domain S-box-containing protein